jgi:hypothetical protein
MTTKKSPNDKGIQQERKNGIMELKTENNEHNIITKYLHINNFIQY